MRGVESGESRVESLEPEKNLVDECFWLSTLDSKLSTFMHTIRLRGPWQVEPLERYVRRTDGRYRRSAKDLPAATRMTMPADWGPVLGGDFLGRVRYGRMFQKPTGLDSGERVWLVMEVARSSGEVTLSRKRLGEVVWSGVCGRFDITELLEDHNRLEIVVEHPLLDALGAANDDSDTNMPGGLVGEVRLEIEH